MVVEFKKFQHPGSKNILIWRNQIIILIEDLYQKQRQTMPMFQQKEEYKMKDKHSIRFLHQCAEVQIKKSNDYQNPNSRVKQAHYYPRGCASILDTMAAKVLRMQSVIEAMELDPNYAPNFESLEDSCIDLANYASFFAAYMNGAIDGQTDDRDFLNRPIVSKGKTNEIVQS